jgi:heme-degrading monooxygenase HmoA
LFGVPAGAFRDCSGDKMASGPGGDVGRLGRIQAADVLQRDEGLTAEDHGQPRHQPLEPLCAELAAQRLDGALEVPSGAEDEFLALWSEVNRYMAAKPGYLSHKLHRSPSPDARYRFVNYVHWDSAERLEAAHDPGFQQLVGKPEWQKFTSTLSTCEVVHEPPALSSRP